jgi:cell wall assembly regulator SMI1
MAVTWENYVWDSPRPATLDEIEALEREWGITFPDDYKRVVMKHQGMTPTPYVIDIGSNSNNVICELMTISVDGQQRSYAMRHVYQLIKNLVPAGIYPFAGTGTGDYICFDYRTSATAPKVIFYFTEAPGEEALYPVADSFTDFLSKLHD